MALDHAARLEGGADHAPEALVGGALRVPHGGPVHDLVEAGDHGACCHEATLFFVAVIAAAPFVGRWRHGGAWEREDLQGRTALTGFEPEFEVVRAVHVGEFVAGLAGPGVAAGQHHRRFPLGGEVRAFDVLVDLAEAGRRREIGQMRAACRLAGVRAGGAGPGDTAALDGDLLVQAPGSGMHVQKAADAEQRIGGALAEGGQHQVLADQDLAGGVDQQVIGEGGHGRYGNPGSRKMQVRPNPLLPLRERGGVRV